MASGLCVPRKQAAHMAAPTEGQNIKNTLANGEPSTHGAKRTNRQACTAGNSESANVASDKKSGRNYAETCSDPQLPAVSRPGFLIGFTYHPP